MLRKPMRVAGAVLAFATTLIAWGAQPAYITAAVSDSARPAGRQRA